MIGIIKEKNEKVACEAFIMSFKFKRSKSFKCQRFPIDIFAVLSLVLAGFIDGLVSEMGQLMANATEWQINQENLLQNLRISSIRLLIDNLYCGLLTF